MSERAKSLRAKMRQAKTLNLGTDNKPDIQVDQPSPDIILPKRTVSYFNVQSSDSDSSSSSSDSDSSDEVKGKGKKKKKLFGGKIKEEAEIDPLNFFNIPELQCKIVPVNPIGKSEVKPQMLQPVKPKQILLTEEKNNNNKGIDKELITEETLLDKATGPNGLNMLTFLNAKTKLAQSSSDDSHLNGTPQQKDDSPNKLLGSLVRSDEKMLQSIVEEVKENPQEAEELDLPILNGHQRNKLFRRMKCARHNFSTVRKLNQGGLIINERIYAKIEELRKRPNYNEETIQKIIQSISLPTYILHDPDVQKISDEENEVIPSSPEVKLNFSAFKLMK